MSDVTEGLTAEGVSTRPSTCVFRRRWHIQRQTRQKIQVGCRGVTNSVSEAKNTEVCVWVWVKVRRRVLQEGKRSLLQISSICSFIFLTLVFVICRGGLSTNVSKSEWDGSFCKKEAGPSWKDRNRRKFRWGGALLVSSIWTIIQFYLNKEEEVARQRDCRMQGLDLW